MMAWEIQNENGLALADIHFNEYGYVVLIEWADNGIVYTDPEEVEIDLAIVQTDGYNCEVVFINGANRVSA